MANYTYPRVDIGYTAKRHSTAYREETDTTVLFVPIAASRGPINEIKKVHSIEELESIYGEISYELNGQTKLNLYHWLSTNNKGTAYILRLVNDVRALSSGTLKLEEGNELTCEVEGKYPGSYYNLRVVVSVQAKRKKATIQIYKGTTLLETHRVLAGDFIDSEYVIFDENIEAFITELIEKAKSDDVSVSTNLSEENSEIKYVELPLVELLSNFWENADSYYYDYAHNEEVENASDKKVKVEKYWKHANDLIANKIETPIDLVLDAGYPAKIKLGMFKFFSGADAVRKDVFLILDNYEGHVVTSESTSVKSQTLNKIPSFVGYEELIGEENGINPDLDNTNNMAIYTQYFSVSDPLVNKVIYVTPSYFLSSLLPYNDNTFGVQWPTAGKQRGDLRKIFSTTGSDFIRSISENPMPITKQSWFESRINYAEKDSHGIYFMNQRTFDGSTEDEYTALSFINNSRTLVRIRHELESLGRNYLFEFNDSVTLSQLSSTLNKYMSNWVANRTLSYANVSVSKSDVNDETVEVVLSVKFTGTIEVISVNIEIE